MAAQVQMGGATGDRIFIGTDGTRDFHVKDYDADSTGATAKNITSHTYVLDIRRPVSRSSALLSATLTITGTFNSVASSNTQRARWTFADTDLTATLFGAHGGTFDYSVKRTDDGSETVVQYGSIIIERTTQI